MESIKGFKVFNPDWTCRGFQYKVGESYEMDERPRVCEHGFHFCLKASDCFNFYSFNSDNKVAEVEAYGDINKSDDESKYCTNKIRIVREITWDEVLRIVNEGKNCTGLCNTGNRNTGDYNTGDWNIISFSAGCFNTDEQKIIIFNKPCDWTLKDWFGCKARKLLNQMPKKVDEWSHSSDMSDEEKAAYPTHETTGGYLKILDESECAQLWWDDLCEADRQMIFDLPNFDVEIFEKCTGIKI